MKHPKALREAIIKLLYKEAPDTPWLTDDFYDKLLSLIENEFQKRESAEFLPKEKTPTEECSCTKNEKNGCDRFHKHAQSPEECTCDPKWTAKCSEQGCKECFDCGKPLPRKSPKEQLNFNEGYRFKVDSYHSTTSTIGIERIGTDASCRSSKCGCYDCSKSYYKCHDCGSMISNDTIHAPCPGKPTSPTKEPCPMPCYQHNTFNCELCRYQKQPTKIPIEEELPGIDADIAIIIEREARKYFNRHMTGIEARIDPMYQFILNDDEKAFRKDLLDYIERLCSYIYHNQPPDWWKDRLKVLQKKYL